MCRFGMSELPRQLYSKMPAGEASVEGCEALSIWIESFGQAIEEVDFWSSCEILRMADWEFGDQLVETVSDWYVGSASLD